MSMAPLIAPAWFRLPSDETLRARFGHVTTWVFDLDNTLYPPDSGIWPRIDERITLFLIELFGLDQAQKPAKTKRMFRRTKRNASHPWP
jgi:FMN phosphatase YigB (HAD superfamily)